MYPRKDVAMIWLRRSWELVGIRRIDGRVWTRPLRSSEIIKVELKKNLNAILAE